MLRQKSNALLCLVILFGCSSDSEPPKEDPIASGGSGGSAAAGQAGAFSVSSLCPTPAIAMGNDPGIATFEGTTLEELQAFSNDGWTASLLLFHDQSGQALQELIEPGHDSNSALRLALVEFSEWGGGYRIWFDGCLDASRHAGIRFWARGDATPARVEIVTASQLDADLGGSCSVPASCNIPKVDFSLEDTWKEYTYTWDNFDPQVAPEAIVSLALRLVHPNPGESASAEVLLDDLAFLAQGAAGASNLGHGGMGGSMAGAGAIHMGGSGGQ